MITIGRSLKPTVGRFRKKILKVIRESFWESIGKNWNAFNKNWNE